MARRVLIIVVALIAMALGLAQVLKGLGMISEGSSASSSPATSSYTSSPSGPSSAAGISDARLLGTWTPQDAAPCATWVRFNADHTLTDNIGATGTWRLDSYGVPTGSLTMTINGAAPTVVSITAHGQDMLAAGNRYWQRASC
jgi:hypothetical protein